MNEMRQFPRDSRSSLETPVDHLPETGELVFEELSPNNMQEARRLVGNVFGYEKNFAEKHIEQRSSLVEIVPSEKVGKDYNEHYWIVRNKEGVLLGITGFNQVSGDKAEHAWLGWFALSEDVRGHGLGSALLDKIVSETRSMGKTALYIVTIDLPEMKGNEKFYNKHDCEVVEIMDSEGIHIKKETGLPREVAKSIEQDYKSFIEKGAKVFIRRKDLTLRSESEQQKNREIEKAL